MLDRCDVAEDILASEIITPFIRSHLTQGRVDGSGGRGSYAGLNEAFHEIVSNLQTNLQTILSIAEEEFNSSKYALDLIVRGVWRPISGLLLERFHSIFNIAIADSFSRCYLAYEEFKASLSLLAGPAWTDSISKRLNQSSLVKDLDSKWKLDVYFHLRSQEVCGRVDRACETGLLSDSGSSSVGFQLVLFRQVTEAMLWLMSPGTLLPPLFPRFFLLSLRLLCRLEGQVCLLTDVNTPHFTKNILQSFAPSTVATGGGVEVSPAMGKRSSPGASASSTPATAGPKPTVSAITVEEMMLIVEDELALSVWLVNSFAVLAIRQTPRLAANEAIIQSIQLSVERLSGLRDAVWTRALSSIASECKRNLGGVRVIAGKYRMTNKPPPDTPSAYVETILQPLCGFIDRHGIIATKFASRGLWDVAIIEEVTGYFLQQVQSLLETVRQMDSALQRRTKARTPQTGVSDSEKIAMQVTLDVQAYGEEVKSLASLESIPSFDLLLRAVAEATKLASNNESN